MCPVSLYTGYGFDELEATMVWRCCSPAIMYCTSWTSGLSNTWKRYAWRPFGRLMNDGCSMCGCSRICVGVPPAAGTVYMPVRSQYTIVAPSVLQLPPRNLPASLVMTVGVPPSAGMRDRVNWFAYAMDLLSGDQKAS